MTISPAKTSDLRMKQLEMVHSIIARIAVTMLTPRTPADRPCA